MRIYVGNLSFNTDEGTLEQLFAPLGAVESVKLIRDHKLAAQAHGEVLTQLMTAWELLRGTAQDE